MKQLKKILHSFNAHRDKSEGFKLAYLFRTKTTQPEKLFTLSAASMVGGFAVVIMALILFTIDLIDGRYDRWDKASMLAALGTVVFYIGLIGVRKHLTGFVDAYTEFENKYYSGDIKRLLYEKLAKKNVDPLRHHKKLKTLILFIRICVPLLGLLLLFVIFVIGEKPEVYHLFSLLGLSFILLHIYTSSQYFVQVFEDDITVNSSPTTTQANKARLPLAPLFSLCMILIMVPALLLRSPDGNTDLMEAVLVGDNEVVETLLYEGVDIEAKNDRNRTALILAAKKGHDHIVKTLLDKGANIEARNKNGSTALTFAASSGHDKVVNTLLKNGADIEASNERKFTALLGASYNGHIQVVKTLLDNGADIEAKNDHDYSALGLTVWFGHENIMRLLLDRGADIEVKNDWKNGDTVLIMSAHRGHHKLVKLLLDRGADIKAKNKFGYDALSNADTPEIEEIIKAELERRKNLVK